MPTKRNRAGEQQNYVPQGNGDASGEYADNQSGSNKHFTNFQQPETSNDASKGEGTKIDNGTTTETTPAEPIKKSLEEKYELGEDSKQKLKYRLKLYMGWYGKNVATKKLTEQLLDGELGSFIRPEGIYSYQDAYPDMEQWINDNMPEKYYYKKGNTWLSTYDNESYGMQNKKLYTESEYKEKLAKEQAKNLQQSKYDVEINKVFGENCAVAFGKGYSDEYMGEIVKASQQVANDFPNMNGFIKAIGDRNSLEKLTQARARESLTEENINKKANEYIQRQKDLFNRDVSMEVAIEKAKQDILNGGLSLTRSGSRTLAYWSPSQRALVMLPKTAKDNADANQVSYYERNWHSSNKPMATYFHEFGHAIDSMVSDYARQKLDEIKKSGNYQKQKDFSMLQWEFHNDTKDMMDQNFNSQYNDEFVKRYNKIAGTNYQDKWELDKALNRAYSRVAYDTTNEVKESLKRDGIKKYSVSEYGATNGQEFCAECFSAYYTGMNNELANRFVERVKKFYNDIRRF